MPAILEVINPVQPDPQLRERFRRLATEWKDKSKFMSDSRRMAVLAPYQQIIGMGPAAIPLILEELQGETDFWFWALEAITGENPAPPQSSGNVELMAQAWLEWGKQRGLLAT